MATVGLADAKVTPDEGAADGPQGSGWLELLIRLNYLSVAQGGLNYLSVDEGAADGPQGSGGLNYLPVASGGLMLNKTAMVYELGTEFRCQVIEKRLSLRGFSLFVPGTRSIRCWPLEKDGYVDIAVESDLRSGDEVTCSIWQGGEVLNVISSRLVDGVGRCVTFYLDGLSEGEARRLTDAIEAYVIDTMSEGSAVLFVLANKYRLSEIDWDVVARGQSPVPEDFPEKVVARSNIVKNPHGIFSDSVCLGEYCVLQRWE